MLQVLIIITIWNWIVTTPNLDTLIRQFETARENDDEVVVKTGFLVTFPIECKRFRKTFPVINRMISVSSL